MPLTAATLVAGQESRVSHHTSRSALQRTALGIAWAVTPVLGAAAALALAQSPDRELFIKTVKPIISSRCVSCHSGKAPAGGLDLSTSVGIAKGGKSGAALSAAEPEKSLLLKMVAEGKMPPSGPLPSADLDAIRTWIRSGATVPAGVRIFGSGKAPLTRAGLDWWSLQPVRAVNAPEVRAAKWVRSPIDAFVLANLEAKLMAPAPPADRRTLIRRVFFDLVGLPPTASEIDAFVRDRNPRAYEVLVEKMLKSPHYGERWARHWLDVARFGESHGYERDALREHAWRYRDYVIDSLNADVPFDQFAREQIAGDVMPNATSSSIAATGFLVAGPWDEVGLTQQSTVMRGRAREEELEEMVGAVSQTFLGMTTNCARCHDHKFDPIPQRDYYRLKAALDGVSPGNRPSESKAEAEARTVLLAARKRAETELLERESEMLAAVRTRLAKAPGLERAKGPMPTLAWSFDTDLIESGGSLGATAVGNAVIRSGRIKLSGAAAYVRTSPLPMDIREKTLEAWVTLPNLAQAGGGVISIEAEEGGQFDAIVYGERMPRQWMAGSNGFVRTKDVNGPPEPDASVGKPLHLAAVYAADGSVRLYRNGKPYGTPYTAEGGAASVATYRTGSARLLFGLRHTGAANGALTGEIDEARLYSRALTAQEIAASFEASVGGISEAQILAAMSEDERSALARVRKDLEAARAAVTDVSVPPLCYAAAPKQPAQPTRILGRGDFEAQGETVSPAGLSAVRAYPSDFGLAPDGPEADRRLKLAKWITDPRNPLTARVIVNRVWHYHFGKGIVGSPNDFGFNGERPSHPKLLDWLAAQFMKPASAGGMGWSLKSLHRQILLSNTYRQSGAYNARNAKKDADNRFLWRFAPQRLQAELVRDTMLALSSTLNTQIHGPSFKPFSVQVANSNFYTLIDSTEPNDLRRSVYRMCVNSARDPLLETLDCPDPSTKTPKRAVTTTPLQALEMMNSPFVLRQARLYAETVSTQHLKVVDQVRAVYVSAFGRPPSAAEAAQAISVAARQGLSAVCWAALNSSEFLYIR